MHLCLKLNNMKYKIIVAYDGTNYQGWQQQKNKPTIAGTLEKTFLEIFKKNIKIFGASRTDANVHAHGQVATFIQIFNCLLQKLRLHGITLFLNR